MSLTTMGAGGGARWFIGAAVAIDFANGWSLDGSAPSSLITTTRASTAWAPNAAGIYTSFTSNAPRITDLGLLTEEARTNVVTYSRDLTNAAWVKSNTTAAKDQTGVDGVTNSASSLTASAGNGTALLTTSIASSVRFQSAFVKRLVGTGTVEMTMDNGSTWTAVTVTAAWTRVTIPSQTLANPIVGFRIGTNADSIAVDFVQNENGAFVTSPIECTGSATARSADLITLTTVPVSGGTWTAFIDATCATTAGNSRYFLAAGNNDLIIYSSVGTQTRVQAYNGTTALNATAGTGDWSTGIKAAVAADGAGRSAVGNNGTVGTDANTQTFPSALAIGARSVAVAEGVITTRRVAFWSSRLPNPQLQALTA